MKSQQTEIAILPYNIPDVFHKLTIVSEQSVRKVLEKAYKHGLESALSVADEKHSPKQVSDKLFEELVLTGGEYSYKNMVNTISETVQ